MPYNNYAFIDGANLHYTYEYLDWNVDYEKLLIYLQKRLNVTTAYYFIGETDTNRDLYTKIESFGYRLMLKQASPYITAADICPFCGQTIRPAMQRYKADVDSFLTMQLMLDFNRFDKAVIITSDGDYDKLVKKLILESKLRLLLASSKSACSWLLKSSSRGRIDFITDHKNELEKI